MTLDEAIENRTAYLKHAGTPKSSDDYNATFLSIGAMKLINWIRQGNIPAPTFLLPGETKD